jgi:chemotaxis protein methyltransferase CheR
MTLTDSTFATIQTMLSAHAGIELKESKRQMVINRLTKSMRETHCASIEAYLEIAKSQSKPQDFINALTTNVTSFNREAHHFDSLKKHLRSNFTHSALTRNLQLPFKIWSAGCSTGQEPYSILMSLLESDFITVDEQRGALKQAPLIYATDIDTRALAIARQGIYDEVLIKDLSPSTTQRFFDRLDDKRLQVKPIWRNLIDFSQLNLSEKTIVPKMTGFDAIFCRNVMIYFNSDLQKKLVHFFATSLKPQGLLFAGHSEMLLHSESLLRPLGKTVYQLRS